MSSSYPEKLIRDNCATFRCYCHSVMQGQTHLTVTAPVFL